MPFRTDLLPLAAPFLQDLVQRRVDDGRAPASSAAVFGPDGVAATAIAWDGRTGPEPTVATAFRIASCTKSFTAATLLTVVEEGRLSLEAPLDEVLAVRILGATRAPTIGELASMAGGIPIDDPWADRQESLTPPAMDALLAACASSPSPASGTSTPRSATRSSAASWNASPASPTRRSSGSA